MEVLRSRILMLAGFLGVLAAGLLAGYGLGRKGSPQAPPTRSLERGSASGRGAGESLPPGNAPSEVPETREGLIRLVAQQREEIRTLRAEIDSSTRSANSPARQPDLSLAEQMWNLFSKMKGEDNELPEEEMKEAYALISKIPELAEAEAPYFVERYKQSADISKKRMALELALASGGKDALTLVLERLRDSSLPKEEREMLLGVFWRGPTSEMRADMPLVVNDELGAIALRCMDSQDESERAGSAGLLGGYSNPLSPTRLRHAADLDASPWVRAAAIRSLGRVGGRDVLAYLQSYPVPAGDERLDIEGAIKEAVQRLKKRFPE